MTDLIQNVQEVYKKWEARSSPSRGRLKNTHPSRYSGRKQHREVDLTRFSRSLQQRNFKRTPYSNVHKYDSIGEFKMSPSAISLHKSRPFVGIPCAKCFPHSKAFVEDETVYLLGVNNILHIPYISLQSLNICCLWNLFKIHSSLPNDSLVDILKSRRVENAIQEILNSSDTGEESSNTFLIEKLHENVKTNLKHLKSFVSSFCIEITGFFLHYLLKKVFSGIFVHKGQMEILKILNKEAIPFVYLPLYRSYFDYLLVPYVLHMNALEVPFIITFDELFIPILGCIFRILGAIFVRKNIILEESKTDMLYDAVVKSYITKCLQAGYSIELFLEADPSVTGKPQTPNTNLLAAVVDSVTEGSIEDVYVVPVSITYEATEGNFVAKQLESNFKDETSIFSKLCCLWKIMHLKYGNVRLNFNQPFSMKEFLEIYNKQSELSSSSPLISYSDLSCKEQNTKVKAVVNDLSLHAFYDATTCTSLMSTHLLAFLLVTQYRKGGTQQQLQNSMDWLRAEIRRKNCDVGFSGESLPVIRRAAELLGKELLSVETVEMEWTSSDLENNNVKVKIYTPIVKLPHVLELQYYANAVVPIFLKESILVNALYALVDVDICHFHHCESRFYVSRDGLVQTSVKLSEFLKYEFITVLPCEDITSVFNDAIDVLIEKECLSGANAGEGFLKSNRKGHTLSFDVSSDEDQCNEVTEQQLKIDLKEESICHLEFLRSILSPYIESYWLAACSLLKLIDEVKEESIFIQEMQMTAKDKLYKGLLAYEESFSVETLKNSLRMFSDRQIIEYDCEDNIKTVCLSEHFNSFESVNEIIADIEDFRK